MRIIDTSTVLPTDIPTQVERDWLYNGMDCVMTLEILQNMMDGFDDHTARTYAFSRDLQGPALEMKLRGVLVDKARLAEVIDEFHDHLDYLERNLERIVLEGVGMMGFNWRSNNDLKTLFYECLKLPPIKRGGSVTTNRQALEKLEAYYIAKPIIAHLKAMRDIAKKISVLRTEIDPDGRMRTSYNIAGTSTGRFSSSFTEFGTGGNLQNVEESLRSIFISDPGMKMAKFDAKSGESFCVGAQEWNLFNDDKYLAACESGDPHTAVAKICWPNLPWTGDLKVDKDIAEQPYYRHYTYRFMCKKLGHGSNYGGAPQTLSEQAKLPLTVVADFQPKYFRAFPAHTRWQGWVDGQLRTKGFLVSLTGRKRWFFGRRTDPSTLREAIAYDPQCSLADIVNTALLKIFRWRDVQLLMHDHDAITIQYPEAKEDEIIPKVLKLLEVPVQLANGRVMTIPYDAKTGWNRGDYDPKNPDKNPDGLKDWKAGDKRKRQPQVGILDRRFYRGD